MAQKIIEYGMRGLFKIFHDSQRILALQNFPFTLPNLQAMATHTVRMSSWRPFRPICEIWTAMLGSSSRQMPTSASF